LRSYGWSFAGHFAVLLLLALTGMFKGLGCQRKPKDMALPIEFLVDVSQLEVEPEVAPPEPAPAPEPDDPPPPPTPKKKDDQPPKPQPEKPTPPKSRKPPIKISTNVVRRAQTPAQTSKPKLPTGPKLTPEEIAKLIELGGKPSDRTVIPGADERALAALKSSLYAAWVRPSIDQRGRRPTQIELKLGRFGVIENRRLIQGSGSAVMDASVERAAAAVRQITNLPDGFTDRFPVVIIEFELE